MWFIIVDGMQGRPEGGADYGRGHRLMQGKVNAAIHGAVVGGPADFVVNDAHGNRRCLIPDGTHPGDLLDGYTIWVTFTQPFPLFLTYLSYKGLRPAARRRACQEDDNVLLYSGGQESIG